MRWNDINRGFHLEYYGDIKYRPKSNLSLSDPCCPMDNTFEMLSARLTDKTSRKSVDVAFDTEIYTLCSLAQYRHISGVLDEKMREKIRKIAGTALEKGMVRNKDLASYLFLVHEDLGRGSRGLGSYLRDFYRVKEVERTGWLRDIPPKRRVENPESIGEHMYGAFLIGLLYLRPPKVGHMRYDKEKVLRMLLIHDLAEVFTGDIPTMNKREEDMSKERKWIEAIGKLGTYPGLSDLSWVEEDWHEFESRQTNESRIAKDIDKLENLMQLYIYNKRGDYIEDFDSWKTQIIEGIATEEGLRIKDIIVSEFEIGSSQ
jgi:putative hydrolase of HD superfamily